MRRRLLSVPFLLLLGAAICPAMEYHVAKTGNDYAPGTSSQPLLTVNAAAQRAMPGDTVTVHSGVYREWVDPMFGGNSKNSRILYRAAEGETVELKGSEPVKGWKRSKQIGKDIWTVTLPDSFFGTFNPFAEEFTGDWLFPPCTLHLGEVFVNGVSMYEAESIDALREVRTSHRDPDGTMLNWYVDVSGGSTTLYAVFNGMDPNQEEVEVTTRPTCFYPSREGINYITLRGFKISQAATRWAAPTAEQVGMVAVHWGKGWIIEDNEIRNSKSSGITLGKEAGTGNNVWLHDQRKDGSLHYLECIFKALRHGWTKDDIGSHIVRNNIISDCGQAGICGSMVCAFSEICGNVIYNVCVKDEYSGCEQAGIKFHGGIDSYIHDNMVFNCNRGLWMDWMGQGSRASRNVFYGNHDQDVYYEMDHGPYVFDNNILLSDFSLWDMSDGGALIHNFLLGELRTQPDGRYVPYMTAHSTDVKGISIVNTSDNRICNNLFAVAEAGTDPLGCYEDIPVPFVAEGNAVICRSKVEASCDGSKVVLKIKGLDGSCRVVESGMFGVTFVSGQPFENPDGSEICFSEDFFGNGRNASGTAPGPFECNAGKGAEAGDAGKACCDGGACGAGEAGKADGVCCSDGAGLRHQSCERLPYSVSVIFE